MHLLIYLKTFTLQGSARRHFAAMHRRLWDKLLLLVATEYQNIPNILFTS